MSAGKYAALCGLMLILPVPAQANGWLFRPRPTSAYYYPPATWAPAIVYWAPPPACCGGGAAPGVRLYATPQAAPASAPATVEPPVSKPETSGSTPNRANYEPPLQGTTLQGTCTVTFRNRSAREVTLQIGDITRSLPAGRGLTLDLPRQFTWNEVGRAPVTEQIPASRPALEIAINR